MHSLSKVIKLVAPQGLHKDRRDLRYGPVKDCTYVYLFSTHYAKFGLSLLSYRRHSLLCSNPFSLLSGADLGPRKVTL